MSDVAKMEQIGQAFTHMERMYELWAKHQGLPNLNVLWIYLSLFRHTHRSQQEICAEFCIAKQTLSPVCKNMLKEGLIECLNCSNVCTDKREKRLQLTEKGKQAFAPILEGLQQLEDKVFTRLGNEKRDLLIQLTKQLSDTIADEIQAEITNDV